MKPIRTWVLIADGARARVLGNDGPGRGLHALDGMTFQGDHAATHEIVDDRKGRAFASVGTARSAIEPQTDPHRQLKRRFAESLAQMLADGLAAKSYDRLVIVAAPAALGDLRECLSHEVREKVIGEIAQDLTKLPNADVPRHIASVLAV